MSTELETIQEDGELGKENPAVHLTSFFGGTARGRCVQLTQLHRTPEGFTAHGIPAQTVALTEHQVLALIGTLREWLDGETPQGTLTEERVRELILEREEELANEPRQI